MFLKMFRKMAISLRTFQPDNAKTTTNVHCSPYVVNWPLARLKTKFKPNKKYNYSSSPKIHSVLESLQAFSVLLGS